MKIRITKKTRKRMIMQLNPNATHSNFWMMMMKINACETLILSRTHLIRILKHFIKASDFLDKCCYCKRLVSHIRYIETTFRLILTWTIFKKQLYFQSEFYIQFYRCTGTPINHLFSRDKQFLIQYQ